MEKEIYINESVSERRIAIVEGGSLVEFYVEKPHHQGMVGNIYKGQVENVIPGMQAAFVDIGDDLNAFLPFSEITDPQYLMDTSTSDNGDAELSENSSQIKYPKVALKTGQDIVVQVIKEPFSGKGPRVTTNIAMPGHLVVLVPNSHFIGTSKKIWDKYEKRRLRKIFKEFLPKDLGIIARTEAEGKSTKLIKKDFNFLKKTWKAIEKKINTLDGPVLVHEDLEAVSTVIRDLITADVSKMVFDSKKLYRRIQSFLQNFSPDLAKKTELYKNKVPMYVKTGIENEIDKSMRRRVWLKIGGHLIIEHTEAMVVVDVNSGRFVGKEDHESNSLKINLEAAKEIAKQLRLRDIGGLIIIDFIDMLQEENRKKVFIELKKEMRKDRAKMAISPISDFGLLEMTRERVRRSLLLSMSEECPTCRGSGRVASKDFVITKIDNWLKNFRQNNRELRLKLELHPSMSEHLIEEKKEVLRKFMWHNFIHIDVSPNESLMPDEFRFFSKKRGKEITNDV